MEQTTLETDGEHAVLEGQADGEWLESDAVIALEEWT